jgi:hypothetical protein
MRIVEKPWGYEEIWAETDRYVGKILYIMAGCRLSLQKHAKKEETVRVMQGSLILTTADESGSLTTHILQAGNSFHVPPGTIHRFGAGEHLVILAEVSTTELNDVIRIEDDYAR